MAYVAISRAPIHVREVQGPVDPGYGQPGFGFGGGHPDNSLPGGGPVDPGFGVGGGPIDPGFGVGLPPIASHPLPPSPGHPDIRPPTYPVRPDNSLPRPPHMWPLPPRPENPDPGYDRPLPIHPSLPIYVIPPEVDNTLPLEPGTVWPPLPDEVTGKVLAIAWLVGIGYRWVVIDTSLEPTVPIAPPPLYPSHPVAPGGERPSGQPVPPLAPGGRPTRPDNTLPETPEPKG